MKHCSVEGCEQRVLARGWCVTHYHRWHRHGDPEAFLPEFRETCGITGCDRPHHGRNMCKFHLTRWERTGDPNGLRYSDQLGTVLGYFQGGPRDECWPWTGPTRNGYGRAFWDGQDVPAHRVVFYLMVGEPGEHLHHTCQNPICVSPWHLERVTAAEHMRLHWELRLEGRTQCRRGHPFPPGQRANCKTCRREDQRRCRERKRAAADGAATAQPVLSTSRERTST